MIGAAKGTRLHLSDGKPMAVCNFSCKTVGFSCTSMSLLSDTTGVVLWPRVRACASSSVSSFVEGQDIHRDLGHSKELRPVKEKHR